MARSNRRESCSSQTYVDLAISTTLGIQSVSLEKATASESSPR